LLFEQASDSMRLLARKGRIAPSAEISPRSRGLSRITIGKINQNCRYKDLYLFEAQVTVCSQEGKDSFIHPCVS
jgi:hypothetical protein